MQKYHVVLEVCLSYKVLIVHPLISSKTLGIADSLMLLGYEWVIYMVLQRGW